MQVVLSRGLVALLHAWFHVLGMLLWNTPTGHATFQLEPAFAEESKALAANQGLYNGFLVAGLVFGLVGPSEPATSSSSSSSRA